MRRAAVVRAVGLVVLAGLIVLAALHGNDALATFRVWLEGVGKLWALVLAGLAYTPASLLLFPGSLLTLAIAALFDFHEALLAVSLGSTLAAASAFLVGRWLARRWVEAKIATNPRFRVLDHAVAAQGFRIVLLTRLSPAFPFTLLNYAFGLTRVSFRDYVLASWIGMFPGTVLYVYLGTAAKGIVVLVCELRAGHIADNLAQTMFLLVGLAATVAVTVVITRIARRALDKALAQHSEGQA